MKRVSFTQEPLDEYKREPIDTTPITQPLLHEMHEIEKEGPTAIATNDACLDTSSSLLIERSPKTELEILRPVNRASPILPDDIIIPPPPLFDTNVSESPPVSEDEKDLSLPPITVIPDRIVLPTPDVAETSMQSNSTNSPEAEVPPPVNYSAFPAAISHPVDVPSRLSVQSHVPSYQVFRTPEPTSFSSDDYYNELSVSPGGDPEPPELLHVHYGTLPSVSHIPQCSCKLHPDITLSENIPTHIPTHYSLRDLRVRNLPSSIVHSSTYPPINPYPSLTTVAGAYNPYTSTPPVCASSHSCNTCSKPPVSPSLPSPLFQDINANVTRTTPTNIDERPKSVQSERRVRFGEVTTAPEPDLLFKNLEVEREANSLPTSSPKPAWSSKIKAFAIGEVIYSVRHSHPHTLGLF